MRRADVMRTLPAVTDERVGFALSSPWPPTKSDTRRIELRVTSADGRTTHVEAEYALSGDPR